MNYIFCLTIGINGPVGQLNSEFVVYQAIPLFFYLQPELLAKSSSCVVIHLLIAERRCRVGLLVDVRCRLLPESRSASLDSLQSSIRRL